MQYNNYDDDDDSSNFRSPSAAYKQTSAVRKHANKPASEVCYYSHSHVVNLWMRLATLLQQRLPFRLDVAFACLTFHWGIKWHGRTMNTAFICIMWIGSSIGYTIVLGRHTMAAAVAAKSSSSSE